MIQSVEVNILLTKRLKHQFKQISLTSARIIYINSLPGQPTVCIRCVGCTGWVRNEWDGSVSMEIQGTESAIDQVIIAIERGHYVRIENMDVKELEPVEGEYEFRTY